MKFIEKIKLQYRANKYKTKNDRGGIAYILYSVKNGQTVLDIGAHKAGYLYFMLKQVGKEGTVYAFEPQSRLYNYIKKIKRLFGWENVSVEHLALSDSKGKVKLYIPSNKVSEATSPGATIVEQKGQQEESAIEEVATETLDAYCQQHSLKPSFLKIDVEGNELRIFQGGINVLRTFKPKILVEVEARHIGEAGATAVFDYLKDLGYVGHFISGSQRLPLSDFDFEKHQNTDDMANYCNNFTFE